jgi:hypothetical protein
MTGVTIAASTTGGVANPMQISAQPRGRDVWRGGDVGVVGDGMG